MGDIWPFVVRWDRGLVERVDRARGDVPRTVWVRRLVERELGVSRTEVVNLRETPTGEVVRDVPSKPVSFVNPALARQQALNKAKGM